MRAAVACIKRDGVDGATTRAIAREAGMNVAAVNYYFVSKDALVDIALARAFEGSIAPSAALLEKSPRAAMTAVVDEMLALFASLAPHALTSFAGADLRDEKKRRAYVEALLRVRRAAPQKRPRKSSRRGRQMREKTKGRPRRPLSRSRRRGKE